MAMTLLPDAVPPRSLGARVMQSNWLARVYDKWWRPLLFRASSGWQLPPFDEEVRLVVGQLANCPGPWLDLSCGPGNLLTHLEAAAPGGRVVGLDLSRSMLERARARAPSVPLVRADAEALPLVNDGFGAVVNLAALDLYRDARRVVAESARVLMPGGRWVATTFLAPAFAVQRPWIRAGVESTTGIRAVTAEKLRLWVAAAGLTEYHERRFGSYLMASATKPVRGDGE